MSVFPLSLFSFLFFLLESSYSTFSFMDFLVEGSLGSVAVLCISLIIFPVLFFLLLCMDISYLSMCSWLLENLSALCTFFMYCFCGQCFWYEWMAFYLCCFSFLFFILYSVCLCLSIVIENVGAYFLYCIHALYSSYTCKSLVCMFPFIWYFASN